METNKQVFIYDTTLRDGSQKKGISYSLQDKLSIVEKLETLGVHYIEGGWPGSNPKDKEFFTRVLKLNLASKIVAFGSTRKKNTRVDQDENLKALIDANTPAVAVVGKSSTLHVEKVLETTLEENLLMIKESTDFLKNSNKEVIYDAEHFFDGYIKDPDYALKTLEAATLAGADWLVLCDTNGGTMPSVIGEIVKKVNKEFPVKIGIHAHNDCELAVANSLSAVLNGARQVQGTINGYGERCGNANLISVIPNLQLKLGFPCVPEEKLKTLVCVSHFVSETANLAADPFQAYVGAAAFAHKGGIHVAAVEKCSSSYEHIEPKSVGNQREIIISELSGRGNVRMLSEEWGLKNTEDDSNVESEALKIIKSNEQNGYQYEGAEGSVELIMRRVKAGYKEPFLVTDYVVVSERRKIKGKDNNLENHSLLEGVQAIIKLECNGELVHTAADGEGPVHALDSALRKGLVSFYPELESLRLTDYKVRILDPETATSAITRVMIEARQGSKTWTTVGCGRNIISASFEALIESFTLSIFRAQESETKLKAA